MGLHPEPRPEGTTLTECWQFLPARIETFKERYGADADAQIADRWFEDYLPGSGSEFSCPRLSETEIVAFTRRRPLHLPHGKPGVPRPQGPGLATTGTAQWSSPHSGRSGPGEDYRADLGSKEAMKPWSRGRDE
jgi:hypothetical protein